MLCLLLAMLHHSVGQAAQPPKAPDKPKLQLPALVAGAPLKEDPKDDAVRKLLKARYNAAVGEARDCFEFEHLASTSAVCLRSDPDQLYAMMQRVVKAGLELCDKPSQKVALLTQYLEFTKEVEKGAEARYGAGQCRIGYVHRARYERLDTEIQLLRVRREIERAKGKE
jgi:hypothetical protein